MVTVRVVQDLLLFFHVYLELTNASSQTKLKTRPENSSAVTYFVSPSGSDAAPGDGSREHPFRTLGFALAKADSTEAITLLLLPGRFSSTNDSYLELSGGKSLTFQGQSATECIVDLESSGPPFLFDAGVRGSHVHFSDMTIANARGRFPAVAVGPHGSSSFSRVVFRNNSALAPWRGPGALIASNTAELTDCLFEGNGGVLSGALQLGSRGVVNHCTFVANAAIFGGAVAVLNGPASFSSCNFVNNTADDAGALFVDTPNKPSTTKLLNCTFWNNIAFQNGGAIAVSYPLQLVGCHFSNNMALNAGGAIFLTSLEPFLQASLYACTFSNNLASVGGALAVSSPAWLQNCSFSNNAASNNTQLSGGGAIWTESPTQMDNCSFVGNHGYARSEDFIVRGGAVLVSEQGGERGARYNFTTITHCTFDSNSASSGGAVHLGAPVVIDASTFTDNFASSANFKFGGGALTVDNFGGNSPVIVNSVFERNMASAGGALSVSRPLQLQNCTFVANSIFDRVGGGGALYSFETCGDEFWIIDQCVFRNNSSPGGGGALYLEGGTLRVQQCRFDHNTVPNPTTGGGAILLQAPNVTLEDCIFSSNTATGGGGAVAFKQRSTMVGCVFVGNIAYGSLNGGGAVLVAYSCETCVSVSNCTFQDNLASMGGAMRTESCVTVTTSSFVDNRALADGMAASSFANFDPTGLGGAVSLQRPARRRGHVHSSSDATNISNCTFTSNMAVTSAGGAMLLASASQLQGCNFANNTSSEGGAVATKSYTVFSGCVFTNNRRVKGLGGASIFVGPGGAAVVVRSALCDPTAEHSITCNGTQEVTLGFSSVVPANLVAPRPCQLVEIVASELLLSAVEPTSIFFGAVCGPRHLEPMYTSWSGVHVSFPAVVTMITFIVVTAPGATLAVTGPLANSSTPAQLTNPMAFQHFTEANSHGGMEVTVSNIVDGACSPAGCFPNFGVLLESPPDADPSTTTEFVVVVREYGRGVSLTKTTLDVVGFPFAWVGITTRLLVQLRDQLDAPFELPVLIVVDGKELPCDYLKASSVYVCSVTFNHEGKYHASLVLRGERELVGQIEGGVTAVSLGWPIAGGVLALLGLLGTASRWAYKAWKRRRQLQADKILANYVGLGRDHSSAMLPQDLLALNGKCDEAFLIDKSFLIPFAQIDLRRDIASGAVGKVSLGTWRGASVAVKRLYATPLEGADRLAFFKELALHKSLRHPNIVQLLGVCTNPLCIVLEFMERGSLFASLQEKEKELPWPLRLRFATDVARGMAFLHGEGILHRDLKSLNVLVDEAWRCKIADFDQSRVDADTLTATVGTLLWSAPEVLRGKGDYGKAADVYSFGIVMFECWTREAPFQHPGAPTKRNAREHILQGGRPVCPTSVGEPPAKYGDVMRRCWEEAAGGRPTMGEVAGMLDSVALESDRSMRGSASEGPESYDATLESGDDRVVGSVQPRSQRRHWGSWFSSLRRPKREIDLQHALLPLTASEPVAKSYM